MNKKVYILKQFLKRWGENGEKLESGGRKSDRERGGEIERERKGKGKIKGDV